MPRRPGSGRGSCRDQLSDRAPSTWPYRNRPGRDPGGDRGTERAIHAGCDRGRCGVADDRRPSWRRCTDAAHAVAAWFAGAGHRRRAAFPAEAVARRTASGRARRRGERRCRARDVYRCRCGAARRHAQWRPRCGGRQGAVRRPRRSGRLFSPVVPPAPANAGAADRWR